MAIFNSPILGKITQSFGNAVTYVSNGQNIVRSKPLTINDAKSEAQLVMRENLSKGVSLYQNLKPLIDLGMIKGKITHSEYNRFIAAFQNAITTKNDGSKGTDMSDITLSNGSLSPINDFTATIATDNESITSSWKNDNEPNTAILNVQKMGFAVIQDFKVLGIFFNSFLRKDKTASFALNKPLMSTYNTYLYAFSYIEGVNSSATLAVPL